MTSTAVPPLAGIRVIELSSYVATPLCGLTLAQLGAEVIRVEPLGGGPDRTRWPVTDHGVSLYWNGLNPDKRGIEVNLADPRGRTLVADLITADDQRGGIVIGNSDRWPELGYAALRKRRPDLIHATLSGTHDGNTAVDYTVQAGSGFPLITGSAQGEAAVNSVVPAWDIAAGLYLVSGVLAAVARRERTGAGAEIRLALEDTALAAAGHLGYLAQAQLGVGEPRRQDGNHLYGGFARDFVTSDGRRFMIVTLTARHWAQLLKITELTEPVSALETALGADFSSEGDRYRHRHVLAGLVADWFGRHDAAVVAELLAQSRLLWAPYRSFDELAHGESAMVDTHPLFDVVEQPGVGSVRAPGSPLLIDGARGAPGPAPRVGADTASVLGEVLRYSQRQIADLAAQGTVGKSGTTFEDGTCSDCV